MALKVEFLGVAFNSNKQYKANNLIKKSFNVEGTPRDEFGTLTVMVGFCGSAQAGLEKINKNLNSGVSAYVVERTQLPTIRIIGF